MLWDINTAAFKTSKQLGGRVLMSDMWGRNRNNNTNNVYDPISGSVGEGFLHHKEGYNILAGDGSAVWYGDDQRFVMWQRPTFGGNDNGNTFWCTDNSYVGVAGTYKGKINGYALNPPKDGSADAMYIWHLFDVAVNTDEGSTERMP